MMIKKASILWILFLDLKNFSDFIPKGDEIKKGNIAKEEIANLFKLQIYAAKECINFWRKSSFEAAFLIFISMNLYKTKDLEKFPIEQNDTERVSEGASQFQKRVKKSFLYQLLKKHDKEKDNN